MAKEYIEREAMLNALYDNEYTTLCPLDEVSSVICAIPAADVVEVFRPDEAVLAEFEDDYKDFEKIKTHLAQIIVEGKVEKPCYSILWWDEKSKEYNIGYSSYCLDYVRKWLELVFEVVEEADVVEVVRCQNCIHRVYVDMGDDIGVIGGCELFGQAMSCVDFCSYGERRDNA